MNLRSVLREPLLHFVAIGAVLFLWYQWGGSGARPGATRIEITAGHIDHLTASYTNAWRRPPSPADVKGLIDDWVREEIAVREAVAAGLDQGDTIVRRRLRQKFEFLAEDLAQAMPPTDEEVESWLAANAELMQAAPRVTFLQIFFNLDQRGASAEADAIAMLERLNAAATAAADTRATIDAPGDATMLPPEIERATALDIDRLFGPGFAEQLASLPPGVWAGPVKSVYGLHLVLVRERVAGSLPELDAVRPLVERELMVERRQQQLDAIYERLLAKYTVIIEPRTEPAAVPGETGDGK